MMSVLGWHAKVKHSGGGEGRNRIIKRTVQDQISPLLKQAVVKVLTKCLYDDSPRGSEGQRGGQRVRL